MGIRRLHQTHTFVTLGLSKLAYDEIRMKLLDAEYDHAFQYKDTPDELIDMQGIAVKCEDE